MRGCAGTPAMEEVRMASERTVAPVHRIVGVDSGSCSASPPGRLRRQAPASSGQPQAGGSGGEEGWGAAYQKCQGSESQLSEGKGKKQKLRGSSCYWEKGKKTLRAAASVLGAPER